MVDPKQIAKSLGPKQAAQMKSLLAARTAARARVTELESLRDKRIAEQAAAAPAALATAGVAPAALAEGMALATAGAAIIAVLDGDLRAARADEAAAGAAYTRFISAVQNLQAAKEDLIIERGRVDLRITAIDHKLTGDHVFSA